MHWKTLDRLRNEGRGSAPADVARHQPSGGEGEEAAAVEGCGPGGDTRADGRLRLAVSLRCSSGALCVSGPRIRCGRW